MASLTPRSSVSHRFCQKIQLHLDKIQCGIRMNTNFIVSPASIVEPLVQWYEEHQRALPWRMAPAGERAGYAVWISEIMAQQTRVETVVEYYLRWMERFPTVEALAAADQQEVLKLWEGLGYYARARNLHRAAQQVVEQHGGQLPQSRAELLKLPGIGEYTVGAICSLAFGQAEPILDGNVKRVVSRLADIETPINESGTLKELWRLARELVEAAPAGQAGMLNEALMELGATVCVPAKPRCLICPIHEQCAAVRQGTQMQRPVVQPRKKTPHYDVTVGVIWQGQPFASPFLIGQRPQSGMLGGMWELPGGKLMDEDGMFQACLQREVAEKLAIEIKDIQDESFAQVRHAYTHFRITLHGFQAYYLAGEAHSSFYTAWRWVELAELDDYPFPVTTQKIFNILTSL